MKNNEQMSPEERLLKAIFGKEWKPKSKHVEEEYDNNYPDTNTEKIGYALYSLTKSLEYISTALQRLTRLDRLCRLDNLPEIIEHNEARMVLDKIVRVKQAVDDVYTEVLTVFKRTDKSINTDKGGKQNDEVVGNKERGNIKEKL